MIAFEVSVNGKKVVLAGVPALGVLGGMVTAGKRRPSEQAESYEDYVTLSVGGLNDGSPAEHVSWLSDKELLVGDEVTFRIVDAKLVDEPKARHFSDPKVRDNKDQEHY